MVLLQPQKLRDPGELLGNLEAEDPNTRAQLGGQSRASSFSPPLQTHPSSFSLIFNKALGEQDLLSRGPFHLSFLS